MAPSAKDRIPDQIIKGDTLNVDLDYTGSSYSSVDYELEITFAPASSTAGAVVIVDSDGTVGTEAITKNAGGTYSLEMTPAIAATLTADTDYHFAVVARDATDRFTIESGRVHVVANLAVLGASVDRRSQVKKTLDQIRDRLAGRSLLDQDSMSIGNRAISRMSVTELTRWESVFAARYQNEVRAERIKRGLPTSRQMKVRFR